MSKSGERGIDRPRLWSRQAYSPRLARELSCALAAVTLAGAVALLLRRWHVRKAPLALAKAAHLEWLAHPENHRFFRESYRSVARLVKWFDALPVDRRTDLCREVGLTIESDQFDESGLYRFSIAHHVPAFRLMRSHKRPGVGVPVVAWRPNDNSEKWDMLRPQKEFSCRRRLFLSGGRAITGRCASSRPIPEKACQWGRVPIRWRQASMRPLRNSPELPKRFVERDFAGC